MPLHDLSRLSWYLTCVQSFSPVPFTVFELQGLKLENNNNNNKNVQLPLIFHTQILSYFRQTYISDIAIPCGGERCGFSLKLKVILKCMESTPRDLRHPYIPSTTVLGDKIISASNDALLGMMPTGTAT